MDYDSSTKFISSLAKFLQSLCNGYVEFDDGVEVIGHIYLNVDTGKKIDYILNEKVCKTDENSVTFISNSFHAQPAEKPKPTSKNKSKPDADSKSQDDTVEIDSDSNNSQTEPKSTNHGTLSRNANRNLSSPSHRQGKRPSSPLKSGRQSPISKRSKIESQDQSQVNDNGPSAQSPAADSNRGSASQQEGHLLGSDYGDSYQQSFNQGEDEHLAEQSEEQDIKPNIDTDVTFVKEEFAPSSQLGEGTDERNQMDEASIYSQMYQQPYSGSQSYSNQSYGMHGSSRLSYGANDRSDMYDPSQGSSQIEGDGTDPSGTGVPDRCQNSPSNATPLHHNSASVQSPVSASGPFLRNATAFLHCQQRRAVQLAANASVGARKDPTSPDTVCIGNQHSQYSTNKDVFGNAIVTTCSRCGGKYTNPATCAAHEFKCNGSNRLMCRICKRVYSQMCALKEHLRGKHGVGEPLICKYCGRSFKYKPQLYDHKDCVGLTNRKTDRMTRWPNNYSEQVHLFEDPKP